ncbi:hypothetical protein [uncultured Chitinophaga sp.]|uniref:hypothetical protein n=1 Tax=uncultured Chitinophaga sp. TaxID=339340 RepID=UPI00260E3203|nr:hypothetical protein [uncultured Chitinophaga sp.]
MTKAALSLVANEKIERDPRKLAYLYPKMPVGRYKDLVDEYYRNTTLRAAEQIAQMSGCILVPSRCLNHKRRDSSRRLMVLGYAYYNIPEDELTDLERAKYIELCAERGEYQDAL